jgi:CRISPR system Cascade subunit CasE
MIYLSRLNLNEQSTRVRAELADPYQMHRTLSKAFGDVSDDFTAARLLFRVDVGRNGDLDLLAQSKTAPQWERLTLTAGYLLSPPEVKEVDPVFTTGQRMAFRLRANPTIKHKGKRIGIRKDAEQLAWLARKAELGGFSVFTAAVAPDAWVNSRTARGFETTLNAVEFNGVILVSDPQRLRETLEAGIGSAKGFGFGLLSLARIR